MKKLKCRECGETIELKYSETLNEILKSFEECFLCNFWMDKVRMAEKGEERVLRIDGGHFWLGDDNPNIPRNERGHGGRKYVIEFLDEKRGRIETTNLWFNGQIPERFKSRLPDNAKIIR